MEHPLDRPIWTALATRQAGFAIGAPPAMRFRPEVEPFIAAIDDDRRSLAALPALMDPDEELILLQARPSPLPDGIELVGERAGVQMIAGTAVPLELPPEVQALGAADAADMQALAELTAPGPFRSETYRLGTFFGIREHGRLVAMAGVRMKVPGLTELSGVCSHPDARGRGYGRLLSRLVMGRIVAAGDRPFLHAYADNEGAIGLYERLGFTLRARMHVQVIRRCR